jgi:hypothetical protein
MLRLNESHRPPNAVQRPTKHYYLIDPTYYKQQTSSTWRAVSTISVTHSPFRTDKRLLSVPTSFSVFLNKKSALLSHLAPRTFVVRS